MNTSGLRSDLATLRHIARDPTAKRRTRRWAARWATQVAEALEVAEGAA